MKRWIRRFPWRSSERAATAAIPVTSPAGAQSAPPEVEHANDRDVGVPSLALDLAATPAAVPLVRHRVMAFAGENGANLEVQSRIGAAVTEAVANAVIHAYPDGEGAVTCDCDVEQRMLEIVVADRGDGFRPGDSPGLGIGLAIIAGCSDHFWIHQGGEDPGVSVWMRFALD
ncbi:MAG TPA: ATP-binding protein [Solirubrobacteraceae bacterium]|jgi:anti-sigma regulatory factor (Ser/Thr protein kinase)|nr:ATP-binding protein [Solirubrobacteraceae bacterium]